VTSRPENYAVAGADASTRLYACPNVASNVSIVHADRNTPGFMRSPPETPYLFALERAMDELSCALGIDPVDLRRGRDHRQSAHRREPADRRHDLGHLGGAARGDRDRCQSARYYNDDLSEYLMPVNADIGEVRVIMLPEHDELVNPLGIKGIGELGDVGMNAAVANAAFHATGVRIRDLPVRIEKLLGAPALRMET
jgi:CO/xanthine dehydrogenase Mo-binding subunit